MTEAAGAARTVPLRAAVRIIAATAALIAVTATFFDSASREAVNPFNFFGYFTMQGNIVAALVLLVAAVLQLRRVTGPGWVVPARLTVTTYMLVVGIVYNLLLAGLAGGAELPWANWVLHVGFPVYAVLDWLVTDDRRPVSFRVLRLVLAYPMIWVLVILVRGATDSWVPYPFLDPASGYVSVVLYVIGIAAIIAGFGALLILAGRLPRPLLRRSAHNPAPD